MNLMMTALFSLFNSFFYRKPENSQLSHEKKDDVVDYSAYCFFLLIIIIIMCVLYSVFSMGVCLFAFL